MKFPKDLPIEAVHDVTSILGSLIALLSGEGMFADSESLADYQETMEHLNRDLEDCVNLYENWQLDDRVNKYQSELEKMHIYLVKADTLLKAMPLSIIH